MTVTSSALPDKLVEIVEDFQALSEQERLQLLLEFSRGLPPLPATYEQHRDWLEQVPECQSPLFLAVVMDDDRVRLVFDAPQEAPTTRGFAGILYEGLDGLHAEDILGVPEDFYVNLGLAQAVSPLRLRGMGAMLSRIKRQIHAKIAV